MKKVFLAMLCTMVLSAAGSIAYAFPFPYSDLRGLGLGGAYVAASEGIAAVNYNPAGLAASKSVEIAVPVSVRMDDHIGVEAFLGDIEDLIGSEPDFATWSVNAMAASDTVSLDRMVNLILSLDQPGKNSVDMAAYGVAALSLKVSGIKLGVGYADEINGSLITEMDSDNIVYDSADPNFATRNLATNSSEIQIAGVEARQLVLSAAKDFGGLAIGANMRNIKVKTYYDSVPLFDNTDLDIMEDLKNNELSDSATAFDLGAQMDLLPMVRAGLVARNVNGVEYKLPVTSETYKIDPRYRAGIAIDLPVLLLVADMDLTTSESFSGAKFREMALGAELGLGVIALRGGLSRNMALDGSPSVYHGGLGLNLTVLKLDVGGSYDPDGNHYSAGASLALKF